MKCALATGLVVVAALAGVEDAKAQSTWTGAGATTNWSDAANWSPAGAPASASTTQVIFGAGGTASSMVDAPWTIGEIYLDGVARTLSGSPLTFDSSGTPLFTMMTAGHSIANALLFNQTTGFVIPGGGLALPGGTGGSGGLTLLSGGPLTLSGPTVHSGLTYVGPVLTLNIGDGVAGPGIFFGLLVDGTVRFNAPGGVSLQAPVTGLGQVVVQGGTVAGFGGPLTHQGTTTIQAGGTLGATVNSAGRMTIQAGGTFDTGDSSVGSLDGAGHLNLNGGTFTTGGDGTSTTFDGQLAGPGTFEKAGAGTMTLAITGIHSGTTVVNGGTLRVGDAITGPGVIGDIVTNATMELAPPGGMTTNGTVTGTGGMVVVANTVAALFGPWSHAGPTEIRSSATLLGSLTGTSVLTIQPGGTLQTGLVNAGALTGGGFLQMNGPGPVATVGSDNTSTSFSGGGAAFGGNGNFTKVGTGTLVLGLGGGVHTGTTTVDGGTLRIGDGVFAPGLVFDLVTNAALEFQVPGAIQTRGSLTGTGTLTVLSGLVAQFGTPYTHAGQTTIRNGGRIGASIFNNARLQIDAGGILDTGGTTVGSLAGAGTANVNSGTLAVGGDNTSTVFSGTLASGGAFVKQGTGTLTLTGASSIAGGTTVDGGRLDVNGTLPGPVVVNAATLGGTGTIAGPVTVNAGGTIAPGLSPGQTNTGDIAIAGVLLQEIEGTTLGTQYDNLNVTGTVAITGNLVLAGAYAPAVGDVFQIITNDGADAVTGTFVGLAEGATVAFNGASLRISYVGGTGNDVTLTAIAAAVATPPVVVPALSPAGLAILAVLVLALAASRRRMR